MLIYTSKIAKKIDLFDLWLLGTVDITTTAGVEGETPLIEETNTTAADTTETTRTVSHTATPLYVRSYSRLALGLTCELFCCVCISLKLDVVPCMCIIPSLILMVD